MAAKLCLLICDQFYSELQQIITQKAYQNISAACYASHCGRPPLSRKEIERITDACGPCSKTIVLGSCCVANLQESEADSASLQLINNGQCFYPFVDKAIIDHWLQQGSYLMTPGWLKNWPRNIQNLGFTEDNAAEFFNGFARQLVLMDTGVVVGIEDSLKHFADIVQLPFLHVQIGLEHFGLYLDKLVLQWQLQQKNRIQQQEQQQKQAEIASYSMAMDLVNQLAETMEQQQAIDTIRSVFMMLFAAEKVDFFAQHSETLSSYQALLTANKHKAYAELESNNGFLLRVSNKNRCFGWVLVSELSFPEYQKHYLNLALTLVQVFALSLENAHTYETIKNTERSLRHSNQQLEDTLSQLKNTQQQLIETEKMAALGRLVSGVAHEINTPVGVGITATSSLLQRSEKLMALFERKAMTYSDLQSYLATSTEAEHLILDNFHRIAELIKSFKQLSIDQYAERRYRFSVKPYIQDIILSIKSQLKNKLINIVLECDEQLRIDNNPAIFAQILSNLLLNSFKHGFKNQTEGEITIAVKLQDSSLLIDYRDNGCGIDKEILPKIFDPFFSTNLQQHSGLGLHIVYNLVSQKLKGQIECESVVGEGAHFHLNLPMNLESV